MKKDLQEFIAKIPKSDLHVHLDGSVRIETLIDLAKKSKFLLPSYTVEGLNELVFKDNYKNLVEYLQGFGLVIPVMQTPENLERVGYEFAMDNIADGVCYVEVRFAPQFHINDIQDIDTVLLSVNKGLNKAKEEYNSKPQVKSGELPEFNYGIIACAMRSFGKGFSKFYDFFIDKFSHLHEQSLFAAASLDLVKSCVNTRDRYGIPIVALDIAGAEAGNPAGNHREAYQLAHENFMHLTAHAGEAYGPESVFQTVTRLYPERIGHGFHIFSYDEIRDPRVQNKEDYVQKLVQYMANQQITFEVCLTSNLQTIPSIGDIKNHAFAKMLAANLSTTICTDNRTVSKTSATKELLLAAQNFDLSPESFKKLVMNGFQKSFYFGSYAEKLAYLERISERYDALDKLYTLH